MYNIIFGFQPSPEKLHQMAFDYRMWVVFAISSSIPFSIPDLTLTRFSLSRVYALGETVRAWLE